MPVTVAQLQARVTADTSDAEAKLSGFGNKVEGLGSGVGKMAGVAAVGFAAIGAGAIAGFGAAVGKAADFESAMSGVGAVAGASGTQLAQLSGLALQLGQDSTLAGVGATDAASAMEQLASGGLSVADILGGGAYGALQLASAGGIDVASAASIAAAAMKNFGLEGSAIPHIADLFAAAANTSAVTVTDLGESMKYVGPVAASMGISLEDVTATLAELGDQGIKGSQAGTSLRSMLVSLASPTAKAKSLMGDLGLQFFDSSGKMKDFGGISEELKTHLSGLSDQQRASTLATLFGTEALSAATILYGQGADGIAKYLAQVNVAGSAAENGAKRNDNLRGSIEQLKSAFETAEIVLGQQFIPVARSVVDWAAGMTSAAIPLIQKWGPELVAGLSAGLGVVSRFGGGFVSAIGAVGGALGQLASGQITIGQFAGGIQAMASAVLGHLGDLAAQAGPYIGRFFSGIMGFLQSALPQISAQMVVWAGALTGWIATAIPQLLINLGQWGTAFVGWLTGTWFPLLVSFYGPMVQAFVGWITGAAIPFLLTTLPQWLAAMAGWITGTALPAIGGFLGTVGTAFGDWITTKAVPWVQANLPLWKDAIGNWITTTALPAIGTALEGVGTAFGDWITKKAIPWVQTNLPLWETAVSTWVTGTALPAIGTTLEGIGTAFGDWITKKAIPWVEANLPLWKDTVVNWVNGTALPAVTTAAEGLGTALGDWVNTKAIPTLTANLPVWKATIESWIDNATTSATDGAQKLGTSLGDWISTTAIPAVSTNMPVWKATIESWIDNATTSALGYVPKLSGALSDWIKDDATPQTATNMTDWVAAITDGMESANTAIQGSQHELSESLSGWIEKNATPQAVLGIANFLIMMSNALTLGPVIIATQTAPMARALWDWITNLATPGMVTALADFQDQFFALLKNIALFVPTIAFDIGKAEIVGMWNGLQAEWPTVAAFLSSIGSKTVAAVGDLSGLLVGAGEDLIRGMISGVRNMAGALANEAANAAASALAAAKDALGIHSPSTEFAKLGDYAMQGFGQGIVANGDAVGQQIGTTMAAVLGGATQRLGIVGGRSKPFEDMGEAVINGWVYAVKSLGDEVWGAVEDKMRSALATATEYANRIAAVMASAGGVDLPQRGATKIDTGAFASIPHLASGGIVTSPTLALIGEAGPEAVVPLGNRGGGGQGGAPINLYFYGDINGVDDFENRVVSAIEKATRRGRLASVTA